MPRELQDKVERELDPGERIQWIDMPRPQMFAPGAVAAFLFGLPWTAFSLFFAIGPHYMNVSQEGCPTWALSLFAVPFILVGLAMLSSPYIVYRQSCRTVYAITDRRAIRIRGIWSTTIESVYPRQIEVVCRKENRDGTGDVLLLRRGDGMVLGRTYSNAGSDVAVEGFSFRRIANPRDIERMARTLAEQAAPNAP